MDSPVTSAQCNAEEVDPAMDALLSIDTTKGNRILNARGIAITPTVKDGYLLRTSEDLLSILETTTGCLPKVLPLAQQDIRCLPHQLDSAAERCDDEPMRRRCHHDAISSCRLRDGRHACRGRRRSRPVLDRGCAKLHRRQVPLL